MKQNIYLFYCMWSFWHLTLFIFLTSSYTFTETMFNHNQCLNEMATDGFKVGKQTKRSGSARPQHTLTSETQASALQYEANQGTPWQQKWHQQHAQHYSRHSATNNNQCFTLDFQYECSIPYAHNWTYVDVCTRVPHVPVKWHEIELKKTTNTGDTVTYMTRDKTRCYMCVTLDILKFCMISWLWIYPH